MKQLLDSLAKTILQAGLVEVEVSARHVHLTCADVEALFGKGAKLHEKRSLSQPGQFLCEERVNLTGPRGRQERVAVLGPERKATQVELSVSDRIALGVAAPVRESGCIDGAGAIGIEGPAGAIQAPCAAIVAQSHIHVPPKIAQMLGLADKQHVRVQVLTERPVTFDNVVIRVSSQFRYKMHIDFDEANAALVSGFTLGRILKD